MRNSVRIFSILAFTLGLCSCQEKARESDPKDPGTNPGQPITVVDGHVVFFVQGPDGQSLAGKEVEVNSLKYPVITDVAGREFIRVKASHFGFYNVGYCPEGSEKWFTGDDPSKGLFLPHGQFPSSAADLGCMPWFGRYTEQDGNVLRIAPPYAVLRVNLAGNGVLSSLQASADGMPVAGEFSFTPSSCEVTASKCFSRAVVNYTENGAPMTGKYSILVLPGHYDNLVLRAVSAAHQMSQTAVPPIDLLPGQVTEVDMTFDPAANLFFDGFDTYVWGGDVMGGNSAAAFSPDIRDVQPATPIDRNPYSYATVALGSCTMPGAAYFSEYKNGSITRVMSDAYWKSRHAECYPELVRAVEYQGCLAISPLSTRGWVITPEIQAPAMSSVRLSFDFSFGAGCADDVDVFCQNAGVITSLRVDGQEVYANTPAEYHKTPGGRGMLLRSDVTIPSSAVDAKLWHHVEMDVDNAADFTRFEILPHESSSSISHLCYVDNLSVDLLPGRERGVRLLFWNILYGMEAERVHPEGNRNYDNFVNWVKSYSPDICVWCEARSRNTPIYLPDGYPELAARYGHTHVCGTGSYYEGSGDNFPQEVTSVYPIEHIRNITHKDSLLDTLGKTSTRVSHGGGMVKVNVGGRIIAIVPLHLIPRGSADKMDCDRYQKGEIKAILDATINNSAYADIKDWIMCGDFNSFSPLDAWAYPASENRYSAHSYILQNTDMVDVTATLYSGTFSASTSSTSRIDYIYVSPSLYKDIIAGGIVMDSWAHPVHKSSTAPEYYPSDHRPVMFEFRK